MYAFGLTDIFDLFTCTWTVEYHICDVPLLVVVVVVSIVVGWAAGVVILLTRIVLPLESVL